MNSLKNFRNSIDRRKFLEKQLNVDLVTLSNHSFKDEEVVGKNIENLIGATQIPLGVAGPLTVHCPSSIVDAYIPLATTEGALVASISRGCKAITSSGGAVVEIENIGITRGPVFKTDNIKHSKEVKRWIELNFNKLQLVAAKTSSHIKLLGAQCTLVGKNCYVRFSFDTADAMGMNMATLATDKICSLIENATKTRLSVLAGNFDVDKKPSWLNFIHGRGRKINAEVVLKKEIIAEILKTTSDKIYEVVINKNLIGSAISGSMGFNAHYANTIAAVFAATGQDLAHVVEGSLGITTAETLGNGDLYISIYLPALLIGTIGGGTNLPTQQEALKIMGVAGAKKSDQLARIIGAAVLAGEISLLASLSQRTLTQAHIKHGRKGKA